MGGTWFEQLAHHFEDFRYDEPRWKKQRWLPKKNFLNLLLSEGESHTCN